MASNTEGKYPGDIIKMEGSMRYSREEATVAVSQTLKTGDVCQGAATARIILASGANANSIILEDVTTDSTDTKQAAFLVRHAVVNESQMNLSAQGPGTVRTALAALNSPIIMRLEA